MAELTQKEFDAANESFRQYAQTQPIADTVRYDLGSKRVIVNLQNGCTFAFPPHLVEGLETASDEKLAQVYTASGVGLHWDDLDVDISVDGLINGIFGTRRWMAAHGGRAKTARKAAAARENGKKGGRPKKTGSK